MKFVLTEDSPVHLSLEKACNGAVSVLADGIPIIWFKCTGEIIPQYIHPKYTESLKRKGFTLERVPNIPAYREFYRVVINRSGGLPE